MTHQFKSLPELSSQHVSDSIEFLRAMQELMCPSDRTQLWAELRDGYCKFCGTDRLPCHCENDE